MTREFAFRRGEHTFFEPLLGFAINVASLATAMEAYTLGFARPFEPQHPKHGATQPSVPCGTGRSRFGSQRWFAMLSCTTAQSR